MAKLLIDNGADLSVFNSSGLTPFHIAVGFDHIDMACLLVSRGVDVNQRSADNSAAIWQCRSARMLRALLELGADHRVSSAAHGDGDFARAFLADTVLARTDARAQVAALLAADGRHGNGGGGCHGAAEALAVARAHAPRIARMLAAFAESPARWRAARSALIDAAIGLAALDLPVLVALALARRLARANDKRIVEYSARRSWAVAALVKRRALECRARNNETE